MKRILITGASGYIGTNVERYLMEYNARQGREHYRVDTLSLRDASWESYDFAPYDTILHLAGKAHADIGRVSEETKREYYEVNCELAVRTAAKAKAAGVPQFIYMSSVIVYGDSAKVGDKKHITKDTKPAPANFYGDSKWQAEQKLTELAKGQQDFYLAIVRPPMVYGKGSKGNFPLLVKLARKTPLIPGIRNERSVIYIDNLAEFLRQLIDGGYEGIYLPQNAAYVTTPQLVQEIGEAMGRHIRQMPALNCLVTLGAAIPGRIGGMIGKAFGSLTIEQGLTGKITHYQRYDLKESISHSVE